MVFIDTSAFFALADTNDQNHAAAKMLFEKVLRESPVTHNYILVETSALIARRLGTGQGKVFLREVEQIEICWADKTLHQKARAYFEKTAESKVSFVDCVSFTLMEEKGIKKAFAFDSGFQKAGFEAVR